ARIVGRRAREHVLENERRLLFFDQLADLAHAGFFRTGSLAECQDLQAEKNEHSEYEAKRRASEAPAARLRRLPKRRRRCALPPHSKKLPPREMHDFSRE